MKNKSLWLCAAAAAMLCALVFTFGAAGLRVHAAGMSGWGFSMSNLDTTCKPCQDFYRYAMGGWMDKNPIPAEYPRWGTFTQLADNNLAEMRSILEAAASSSAPAGSNERKIGDFYSSCMDTAAINAAGVKPLEPEFAAINAISNRQQLNSEIARLHRFDLNAGFRFGSTPDFKDSSHNIAEADQGGLGMPDRDYYLRDDDKSKQLRVDYVAHVTKMFTLGRRFSRQGCCRGQDRDGHGNRVGQSLAHSR